MLFVDLDQLNGSGSNHANVLQTISQSTSAAGDQSQIADFDANVFQDTDSGGNNFLQQSQTLTQLGRASGSSSISQVQDGQHDGVVHQDALSGDSESLLLSLGGMGFLQASEDGFSKAHVTQTETQTLRGPGSQDQTGPMNCCSAGSQFGSPAQTLITLHQSSTQNATQFDEGTATQFQRLKGDCSTYGTCTIHQQATNEAESLTQKESGTELLLITTCSASGGEGFCFAGPGD